MPRHSTLRRWTVSRSVGRKPRIVVTFYDPDERESLSITVYPGRGGLLNRVARSVQDFLGRSWITTRLDDRRHKRR